MNELIEWSENLDFDSYVQTWSKLSTSDYTDNYINGKKVLLFKFGLFNPEKGQQLS